MLGYHFTTDTLRDGRPIPPVGEWLVHSGPLIPCRSGLHASEHPLDALFYAPGPLLHKVVLDGEMVAHGHPVDKWCGRRRCILETIDATMLLNRFIRWGLGKWGVTQPDQAVIDDARREQRDKFEVMVYEAFRQGAGHARLRQDG